MKQQIIHWAIGGGAALLLSAAGRALPTPDPMGSKVYAFVYSFAQNVLANFDLNKK